MGRPRSATENQLTIVEDRRALRDGFRTDAAAETVAVDKHPQRRRAATEAPEKGGRRRAAPRRAEAESAAAGSSPPVGDGGRRRRRDAGQWVPIVPVPEACEEIEGLAGAVQGALRGRDWRSPMARRTGCAGARTRGRPPAFRVQPGFCGLVANGAGASCSSASPGRSWPLRTTRRWVQARDGPTPRGTFKRAGRHEPGLSDGVRRGCDMVLFEAVVARGDGGSLLVGDRAQMRQG